jgi:hypothetical protein
MNEPQVLSAPPQKKTLWQQVRKIRKYRRSNRLWLRYTELRNYCATPDLQKRLWADYAALRKWYRALAPDIPPVRPNRVVMVGCMSTFLYGNKLEAMLALGLRLEGWKVRVLLNSRKDIIPRRIFDAFGFHDFVYWEDFIENKNPQTEIEIEAALDKWMTPDLTLQAVKQWSFGPCWLGPQIISMLHRQSRRVGLDLGSPEIRQALSKVARFAMERARRAESILKEVKPDLIYMMEPNYAQFGPLVDLAVHRKVPVIHTVQQNREDAMFFWKLDLKTRRDHPLTISSSTLDNVARSPWTEEREKRLQSEFEARYTGKWYLQRINQVDAVPRSKQELLGQLQLDPTKKIACVFSHLLWDANLFYGKDLFEDYGDWFAQTLQAAYCNTEVNWLIKLHPVNLYKRRLENMEGELAELTLLREKCGPIPSHVHILLPDCGISSLSLYQIADCGVTVRGTCGFEMSCFGTPIITAGTGRYSGLGFSIDSTSREEYLKRLAEIQHVQPLTDAQILRAKQYAYTLFVQRPWKMRSFRAKFADASNNKNAAPDPLTQNLLPVARTLQEIRNNGDLANWAQWAEHGTTSGYVEQDTALISSHGSVP